jgi:hypothetical protein
VSLTSDRPSVTTVGVSYQIVMRLINKLMASQ